MSRRDVTLTADEFDELYQHARYVQLHLKPNGEPRVVEFIRDDTAKVLAILDLAECR
jgi:hypothetical protein